MAPRSLFVTLLIVGLAVVAGGLGIAAGQRLSKNFWVERYGEPLFFPNSDDWRKRHGGSS